MRLLTAELLMNRRMIESQLRERARRSLPPAKTLQLYSKGFDGAVQRLTELLPLPVVLSVYWSYRHLDRVNALAARFWNLNEAARAEHLGEAARGAEEKINDSYQMALEHSALIVDRTIPALEYAALPRWSRRSRALRSVAEANASEMAAFVGLPDAD